jgi:hypothetical protein
MRAGAPTLGTGIVATQTAKVRRAGHLLRLEGELQKPATVAAPAAYATLPLGYRPAREVRVPIAVWNATDSVYVAAIAVIGTDGTIVVKDTSNVALVTAKDCHIYLDTIQFPY